MTYVQKVRLLQRQEIALDRGLSKCHRKQAKTASKDAELSDLMRTIAHLNRQFDEGNDELKKLQARFAHTEAQIENSHLATKLMTADAAFLRAETDKAHERLLALRDEVVTELAKVGRPQKAALKALIGVLNMMDAGPGNAQALATLQAKIKAELPALVPDASPDDLVLPRL
jgi:chromosome segregation ATPase